MGLTYYFQFRAAAAVSAESLLGFLRSVEREAIAMGFGPTMVLHAKFDTPERRLFSRRLTTGIPVDDPGLRGEPLPESLGIWFHDEERGTCRVAPEEAVVLILTDDRGQETVFGFFRYPDAIRDDHDRKIVHLPGDRSWCFSEFLKTPDPRFRKIVRRFANEGFLMAEHDDYHSAA